MVFLLSLRARTQVEILRGGVEVDEGGEQVKAVEKLILITWPKERILCSRTSQSQGV